MSTLREQLTALYYRYVGEPANERDIYIGFGLFFAGVALAVVGFVLFLYSNALESGSGLYWQVREIALVCGFIGLPAVLLSVVVLLPVGRRTRLISAVGTLCCLVATVILIDVFPYEWTTPNSVNGSVWTISTYATGLVLLTISTGTALVAQYLEKATVDKEPQDSSATTDADPDQLSQADVDADIEEALADTELSWGGVEQQPQTERLNLDMPDTDTDIEGTSVSDVDATTTRADSNDVDDAVAGLRKLQGGESTTERGSGTEQQVDALTEFREQQPSADEVETGVEERQTLVERLRSLFN